MLPKWRVETAALAAVEVRKKDASTAMPSQACVL